MIVYSRSTALEKSSWSPLKLQKLSSPHGKAVVVPPVLGCVARKPCAASCIFKGGMCILVRAAEISCVKS